MSFVLVFDVPRELVTERKRINLELHRMDAEMIQHSFWKHEKLKPLIEIASNIRKIGGQAVILEEKFIF